MAVRKEIVPGRFEVKVVSRHPRLRDYDQVTHRYADAYVNPLGYTVTVDAFPGKILRIHRNDQQASPGGDTDSIRDIWDLQVLPGTTGWEFSIEGRVFRPGVLGPLGGRSFSATETHRLVTTTGVFDENGDGNAWNWRIGVPGPGIFTVSVRTLTGAGAGQPRTHKLMIRDLLVASIGDSAASGQGNPDIPGRPEGFDPNLVWWEVFVLPVALYKLGREALKYVKNHMKKKMTTIARALTVKIDMDPEPVWLEPKAYRSLRSGHTYAARLLEDRGKGTVVTFLPFGRTGSKVQEGLLGPRGPEDQFIGGIGQVAELAQTVGNRRIDALLIYIGTNDAGVATTLENLLKMDTFVRLGQGTRKELQEKVRDRARDNIATLRTNLVALEAALQPLNIRHIYLCEYPTGLFDGANGEPSRGCGIFNSTYFPLDLTVSDARLVRQLAEELNTALREEAEARASAGWFFVSGIAADFRSHGYCREGDDRWFVQAEESMGLQGDTEGTIHPNEFGVMAIGNRVAAMVGRRTVDQPEGRTIGTVGGTVGRAPTAATRGARSGARGGAPGGAPGGARGGARKPVKRAATPTGAGRTE